MTAQDDNKHYELVPSEKMQGDFHASSVDPTRDEENADNTIPPYTKETKVSEPSNIFDTAWKLLFAPSKEDYGQNIPADITYWQVFTRFLWFGARAFGGEWFLCSTIVRLLT